MIIVPDYYADHVAKSGNLARAAGSPHYSFPNPL